MSKFKEKELLEYFDDMCLFLANHHWTKRDERAVAIRKMIQKSKVTEESVEKMAEEMLDEIIDNPNPAHTDMHNAIMFICKIFDKAGVEVVGK